MTTRRTKVLAIATAALLAIGLPVAAQDGGQDEMPMGVIVTGVDPDGPAAAAGIERGDLILGIDGQDLGSARDLVQALADAEGSEVTLSIKHGDDMRDQIVAIERIWGQPRIGLAITGAAGASVALLPRRGLRMPLAPERRGFQFRIESDKPGVVVREVADDSAAASAGLQAGDWITAVGGQALDGPADQLLDLIGGHEPGAEVSIDFQREGEEMTATVTLGENPETGAALLGIRYQALPNLEDMRQRFEDMRQRFEHRRGDRGDDGHGAGDKDMGADSAL
ncbi:MAG: PDZ domain-containing protein [Spirochaetaceae bacterium]|nr:PDZ domain-containing protein [Spirochaetaceae bacterium]